MGIVLLILKILGITILCILGLVLLILALVLFVPIRYRASGSIESKENHRGTVMVHWLLHAIDIRIIDDPETKTISKRIRILGLFGRKMDSVLFPKPKDDETEDGDEEEADDAAETAAEASGSASPADEDPKPESAAETVSAAQETVSTDQSETANTPQTAGTSQAETGTEDTAQPEEKPSESGGDGGDTEEKPRKKRSIGERIEDLKETAECVIELFGRRKDLLKEYLTKKSTKAALGKLWKTVLWLLKTIAPRKGHAEITFGLKDPETTGKVFAAASALYPWYGKHIDIYPEFSGEKIEGEGDVRGRIRLWGVVIRALGILFDKNIKKVRKEFTMVKDKMMKTPEELKKIIKKEDAA